MFCQQLLLYETARDLRSGEMDLLEFVNFICDRIEKIEPHIFSLIAEDNRRKRLLHDAKILLKLFPDKKKRPPFFGIPVGIKDIFRVDGFETRCGSSLPAELFQGKEASCVSKLKNAGALILGKTVTTEFAYFKSGPTRNPCNIEYTPGGSSSGSAAAVAAGLTPFSTGTQTIGSIIRPAAYCGVIGFKPSYGRIATDGVIPFSQAADHVGFFTQDMDGCIMAASVLCNDWQKNISITQENTRPLIAGVAEGKYLSQAYPDILENFEKTLEKLSAEGAVVKRFNLFEDIEDINKAHRLMIAAELAKVHSDWYNQYKNLYSEYMVQIIEEGLKISSSQLEKAKLGRFTVRNKIESIKEKEHIDFWISPATVTMPPQGLSSTGSPLMNLPWTYAGLPAIAVPSGRINGFPAAIQCCGAFNKDELLLNHIKVLQTILSL